VTTPTKAYYLGCISGTSVDGLDLALLNMRTPDQPVFLHAATAPFPDALRARLLELGKPGEDDLDALGWADSDLGAFIGHAINRFLVASKVHPDELQAIGSHGQTVRHRPPTESHPNGFSTQIGDPNLIAEITGITTVADFRRRDMAAGGQGAPLVPPFHEVLFGAMADHVAVLNIGGISNVSILGDTPFGFDTGPGNALMDSWCALHINTPFDKAGEWAASGQINATLLEACLQDVYFDLVPPKSTGREYFNLQWLEEKRALSNVSPVDVQATLSVLTALCTIRALQAWAPGTEKIVVCGGGRLNRTLMNNLQQHSSAAVSASEEWNIDGDSIEAGLFAWLAFQRINNLPGNEPLVTGAKDYRILGAIYPG